MSCAPISAAGDVGAGAAIRDLGRGDALAAEYLEAELGPGLRHSWIAAAIFVATATLVLILMFSDAAQAFGDGELLLAAGAIVIGRLWRAIPRRRNQDAH